MKQIKRENIANVILIIAAACLVILLLLIITKNVEDDSINGWVTYIGAFIAIANAMFLYATLTSQNRGISNQEDAYHQERFETTFFNLLNFHRKLADELHVNIKVLNENLHIDNICITGRSFFSFAMIELNHIKDSLESEHYKGKFDEFGDTKSIEAIEQRYSSIDSEGILYRQMEKELIENYKHHRIAFTNLIYNITEESWAKYHSSDNMVLLSFEIFCKIYFDKYEQYIRSLRTLIHFAKKGKDENYTDFATAQMTKDELEFVKLHCFGDETLNSLKTFFL